MMGRVTDEIEEDGTPIVAIASHLDLGDERRPGDIVWVCRRGHDTPSMFRS
jgi:hypothetical protein